MRTLFLIAFLFSTVLISAHSYGQCSIDETYTVGPPGPYFNGQVVTICYTVDGFNQTSANWLHGFSLTLGSAWDPSSIVVTQMPPNQSGNGTWGYYNSFTSNASGQSFGPGVFYDTGSDNNPGNNYGDPCPTAPTCTWTFCFTVTVADATGIFDLFVQVTSDGTSGSWSGGSGGCGSEPLVNVVAIPPCIPPVITPTVTNPTCADGDGSIVLNVTGGNAPYVYNWSPNGETTSSIINLYEGTYDVSVKDVTGCISVYSATLAIQDSVVINISQSTDPLCNDECTGTAFTNIVTGNGSYVYSWSNGEVTANASQLCFGPSSVTVTDAHGCIDSASLTLLNPPALALTFTTVPTSCYGYGDGKAFASVQNGTPAYTFAWAPTGAVSDSITNVPAGLYYVLATDANSCTAYSNVLVAQPLPMLLDFQVHDVRCFGDSSGYVEFAAAQGTAPYSFAWSTGDTLSDNVDLMGLTIGNYSVVVTDASGCTTDSSVLINQPTPVVISFQSYPASCEVAHDGYDTAFATGGVPGYNFVWNTVPQTIGPAANNLQVGTYTVSVTDVNNCLYIDSSYVVALPLFGVTASDDQELIRGFYTMVSVETDTFGNFGYSWTPSLGVDNPYGWTTTVMPDSTVTYTVMVTDFETGCQNSDSLVITVTPNPYLYVPNAFSPNGDDMNDMFFPVPGDGVTVKSFRIFNRWGERIYGDEWFPGWDGRTKGKPCPLGVYVYYCDYTKPDGTLSRKQGTVLLMR